MCIRDSVRSSFGWHRPEICTHRLSIHETIHPGTILGSQRVELEPGPRHLGGHSAHPAGSSSQGPLIDQVLLLRPGTRPAQESACRWLPAQGGLALTEAVENPYHITYRPCHMVDGPLPSTDDWCDRPAPVVAAARPCADSSVLRSSHLRPGALRRFRAIPAINAPSASSGLTDASERVRAWPRLAGLTSSASQPPVNRFSRPSSWPRAPRPRSGRRRHRPAHCPHAAHDADTPHR